MFIFRNSVGRRLILIVIGLTVLVVGVVLTIAINTGTNALRALTRENFTRQHIALTNSMENQVEDLRRETSNLAEVVSSRSRWSSGQVRAFVIEQFGSSGASTDVVHVHIYRTDNQPQVFTFDYVLPENAPAGVILPINRADDVENIPDDAWIRAAAEQGEATWHGPSEPLYGSYAGQVMSFAFPVTDPAGLIWVDVPVTAFQNTMNIFNQSGTEIAGNSTPSEYIILTNNQQEIITGLNTPDALPAVGEPLPESAIDLSGVSLSTRTTDPFDETLNAFVIADAVGGTDSWQLVTVVPDVLLSQAIPPDALARLLLATVIGLVLLEYAVQRYIRRAVAQPINRLSQAAQEIGDGDLRYALGYQGRQDEIGQLARALDDMKSNLAHTYEELKQSQNTLEQRVERRTRELDIARREAQANANELRAVYDESLLVVSAYQLQTILQTLVQRIYTLLEASYTAVWLISENDADTVRLVANTSEDKSKIGMSVSRAEGKGLVANSIERGELVVVDDYATWSQRLEVETSEQLHQAMSVPLIFSGEAIGAVIVGRKYDAPFFEVDDQRLLRLFANLVSPAVRNAQLFVQRDEAVKEAQRANRVKTRFLASVTHELRTPLNLVINNMDFMRIGVFGEVTDEQKMRLDQTIRSAEHLLYLINDLLDVSKIEAGEMELFLQEADLYTLLDDAIANAEALLEQYEKQQTVEFITEIDEDIPRFPMDARRVRQVLVNLLSNAVKFTEAGSVELRVTNRRHYVRFDVIDSGIGVPEDELDKLFQAFERTNSAKEKAIEGTGLGLPICKFLVEAHGGKIEANLVVGKGTTFTFTLPTKPKPSASDTQQMNAMLDRTTAEN